MFNGITRWRWRTSRTIPRRALAPTSSSPAWTSLRGDQVASLRPFPPNAALGRWPEPTSREGVAARQAARAKRGWFAARLHDLFGEEDDDSADEPAAAAAEATAVVPALALVASEALRDEEVFLNYRLSTHVERPEWYHPVDAEEDKRRWASD